jgi:nitrogen fixation protein FixH
VAGGGATATTADSSLTATLDTATAMRAAIRDGAWIVPLDADEATVEVRYRW